MGAKLDPGCGPQWHQPRRCYDRVVVIGSGALPARCASHLLGAGVAVNLLIESEPDAFSTLRHLGVRRGVPCREASGAEIADTLLSFAGLNLVLSANNTYLFPPEVCESRRLRIVNFHGGLLPGYAGRNVATWVLFNRDPRHGATWHLVDPEIDAGPILAQAEFVVPPEATAGQLMSQAMALGLALFAAHWKRFLDPAEAGRPQERPGVLLRRSQLPNSGALRLDWDCDTASRFLRSMDYGPLRVVPAPRIVLGGRTFAIGHYRLQRLGSGWVAGGPDSGQARPELTWHDGSHVTLRFPDGHIELFLEPVSEQPE